MAAMLTIDNLPDEVLEFVFSKLTLRERKNVKLVSKHWCDICNNSSFTKDERIRFSFKDIYSFISPRRYLNIHLKVDFNNSVEPFLSDFDVLQYENAFWDSHGDSIRSLTVKLFRNHPLILVQIMQYCPNITDLTLMFSDSPKSDNIKDDDLKSGSTILESLLSLTLDGAYSLQFVRGAAFSKLTQSVPNLKRLELNCSFKEDKLCLKTMLSFITRQSHTLTELVFSSYDYKDNFLDNVFAQMGPQLTGLHLVWLNLDSIDCLTRHASKLPNLKNLELTGILFKENRSLSELLFFRNLEFILFDNTFLSDDDLLALAGLENVRGLSICDTLCSHEGIFNFLGANVRPKMVAFQLYDRVSLGLASILSNLSNLKFLDLRYQEITPIIAQTIVRNCSQLTHLCLMGCNFLAGTAVAPEIFNGLLNLDELNLSFCRGLEPRQIENICFDKLRTIHFADFQMSEEGFKMLLKNCPRLSRIYLGGFNRGPMAGYAIVRNTDIFRFLTADKLTIFNFSGGSLNLSSCKWELDDFL